MKERNVVDDEIVFLAEPWLVALRAAGVDDPVLAGVDRPTAARAECVRRHSGSLTVGLVANTCCGPSESSREDYPFLAWDVRTGRTAPLS